MSDLPQKQRWEEFANEYFQRKVEANKDIWSSKDWFMEGVRYGKDQTYIDPKDTWQTGPKQASTQDEFKEKYGQYGEKYKPQTDPNVPWNPKWDNL